MSKNPVFTRTERSVDRPESADGHKGERPQIKADKSPPLVKENMVTNIQQCHIRPGLHLWKKTLLNG